MSIVGSLPHYFFPSTYFLRFKVFYLFFFIITFVVQSIFDKAAMLWWSLRMRTFRILNLFIYIISLSTAIRNFYQKILFNLKYQRGRTRLHCCNFNEMFWKMNFLNRKTKSLKKTKKVFYSFSRYIPATIPNVYARFITSDKHKLI